MMDSQRTVHRCLLIPEIIGLICGEATLSRLHRLKTLAALASTCRFFQEPALDCLWSKLSNIGLLVKTMPSDLWKEKPIAAGGPQGKLFKLVRVKLALEIPL
jgi:hypothetical protein